MAGENNRDYDDLEWLDSVDEIFKNSTKVPEARDDMKPKHQDTQPVPEFDCPDCESGFLNLNPANATLDAGLAYHTVITKLCNVRSILIRCVDACQLASDNDNAAKRQFFDDHEIAQSNTVAASESLEQLYSHLDDFLAWFASVHGDNSLSRFDPSPASVLLDAWSDVSELVDTLKKRAEKIGNELGLDDRETTDDSPKTADRSSKDSFDLYEELDRKFAELYGRNKSASDDDSDISPIFRRESFKDWLKRMIEGIEDLLQTLMPVARK